MGNSGSSGSTQISAGLKSGQDSQGNPIYQMVNLKGGGQLIDFMKYALNSGDYNLLDGMIEIKVSKFLYGEGKGKLMPIAELVKIRNKERNAMLGALRRKKGKGKSGPNILEGLDQDMMQGDMMKALKMLDGGGKKGASKYRELSWDTGKRGAIGETLLHVCLLQGTTVHNELSKRLIHYYPKLVNDIFLSEDYYGQTALHQAIVNEDPEMVRHLIQSGADVNSRCYGSFFCPDDQRSTRSDSLEHEWVDMNQKTNYPGRMYWGEYPLAFAACTGQADCFRLLRTQKADPNLKDTNGNTVLHLMVIHDRREMFDLALRLGGKLHITNNQNLIPLTLAAFLAKKEMFKHVLEKERDVLWTYGDIVCAAYPLQYIDTIDQETGELNPFSALGLIIYGETGEHLELLDGLMEDLLQQKWIAFAKKKLIQNFLSYVVYFILFFISFELREYDSDPQFYSTFPTPSSPPSLNSTNNTTFQLMSSTLFSTLKTKTETESWLDDTGYNETELDGIMNSTLEFGEEKKSLNNITVISELIPSSPWFYSQQRCHLLHPNTFRDKIRLGTEFLVMIGTLIYVTTNIIQARRIGRKQYLRTMAAFPAKAMFNCSFILVFFMIPLRLACRDKEEHVIGVVAVLLTSIHFLFFCRGIKFVGPFVLMVYRIILGDLARFFIIYGIFVMGFSQAFFVIFKSCDSEEVVENIMNNPLRALARMFIMSVGEFSVFYRDMNECRLATIGKFMFFIFELLVSIMLINLWAKVILMLERALAPKDRLEALLKYSRPIGTNKRKRAFVVKHRYTEDEREEVKEKVGEERKKWEEEEKRAILKRRLQGDYASGANSRAPSAVSIVVRKKP